MTETQAQESNNSQAGHDSAAGQVAELLRLLSKCLRAQRLYQPNNPVYQSFIKSLADAFEAFWGHSSSLRLVVHEDAFVWEDTRLTTKEDKENLAFVFFKDGVRYLTFFPGFEHEVPRFLEVLQRAGEASQTDDLLTLLWSADFSSFQYGHIDPLGGDIDLDTDQESTDSELPASELRTELKDDLEEQQEGTPATQMVEEEDSAEAAEGGSASITKEDFEESLFFLDPQEIATLQAAAEEEWDRDLRTDVLNALLDRLQDPLPGQQREILGILRQLLLAFLARGDLSLTNSLLEELQAIMGAGELLENAGPEAEAIFKDLNEPSHLEHVVRLLETGDLDMEAGVFGIFMRHLKPSALQVLIRLVETTESETLQERLTKAIEAPSRQHSAYISELIDSSDATLAAGAARLAGNLGISESVPNLKRMLADPDPALRITAVRALAGLRSGPALQALEQCLQDDDRDVRIAAANAFGKLRYRPALRLLEGTIQSKRLKYADLTEKLAFFEAYGALRAPESVPLLDRVLNGRDILRRTQPTELRACAAVALGLIGTPAARSSLERAKKDKDAVLQRAVISALKQEQET